MAISKQQKEALVALYQEWLSQSRAVILTEYTGLSMMEMTDLRRKVREIGGEFHVIKNTLAKIAFNNSGYPAVDELLEGSSAAGFAFTDAPALAKMLSEFAKSVEIFKIKGGYLDQSPVTAAEITALAELPPLPVMRAQLLGTLMAPASRLARTLAEPARELVTVLKAYADKEATPSPA